MARVTRADVYTADEVAIVHLHRASRSSLFPNG